MEAADSLRVFFDGRKMLEGETPSSRKTGMPNVRLDGVSPSIYEIEIRDNGFRIFAETLRLPEGTLLLDADGEREIQTLNPQSTPQFLFYAHGRVACAWRDGEGATVFFFGDSPKELMNGSTAVEKFRQVSPDVETPVAQRAAAILLQKNTRFLRAEIGQFLLGARNENNTLWLAGATGAPRVWTLRLEDLLDEKFYTLTLWRDGLPVDGENFPGTEIEEIFQGVTRHDKPAVEMAKGGGFVARFEPCHETEFKMVKGARE